MNQPTPINPQQQDSLDSLDKKHCQSAIEHLQHLVHQETDNGRTIIRSIVSIMTGDDLDSTPHHRLQAARLLLKLGFQEAEALINSLSSKMERQAKKEDAHGENGPTQAVSPEHERLNKKLVGSILPWLGLSIGVLLTLAGAWLLGGGKLYTALAQQMSERFGNPGQANVRGYFLFGLAYGLASLSCTLPIFLAVIGASFATASIWTAFAQFVLYALGMGSVIITLTLGIALFKGAMVKGMRKVMPYMQPIGTWLMLIAGTYIVFYWLTIGNVLG